MHLPEPLNLYFLDAQYRQYQADPDSVGREWQLFFQGFEIGCRGPAVGAEAVAAGSDGRIEALIDRYRELGHLLACTDPLHPCPTAHPLLALEQFGLEAADLERVFASPQFPFLPRATLTEMVEVLQQTYCRAIGVEYMHLENPKERCWLQERMEPVRNQVRPDVGEQRRIARRLIEAACFEQFLSAKYQTVTRFSLEGGDALIPMLDDLLPRLADGGVREIILGMAHRGRLNIQATLLGRPVEEILAEFEYCYDFTQVPGQGDVKYHNGYFAELEPTPGTPLLVLMVNNSSALEAVDPVVEGVVRARQFLYGPDGRRRVMPLLIHGDAAFSGQGIVAETLNMSQLAGFTTGGTLHVVINNQIGYTTLPPESRSTRYATDLAKMLMVPIFHVHGDHPESLLHAARLAADFRQTFGRDVVLDLVCFRRHGHNEGDEPTFTQPEMYRRIAAHPSLHTLYSQELISAGVLRAEEAAAMETTARQRLEAAFVAVHGKDCPIPPVRYFAEWQPFHGRYSPEPVATAVDEAQLRELARRLNTLPPGFAAHSKIEHLLARRRDAVDKGQGLDWANGEALAFASLLAQGLPIRLSGQDCGRGTFSQRHSQLFDRETGGMHVPLNALAPGQAPFEVVNSLLSEAGVLAFEYGFAATRPQGLTLWEAQFGDFANNAQAIIDQYLVSGETKWQRLCGLVLLLPHGWEGLGPEHSSARVERFLQLCAEDNIQVCNPTTPAQHFHLLRRQALADYRKPLVILTPKSLLRHPQAISPLAELSHGGFAPVLTDPQPPVNEVRKVLLCSGKIAYQLMQRCREVSDHGATVVRIEQLYPFPHQSLEEALKPWGGTRDFVWVQEEPENMGAWAFVRPRLEAIINTPLAFVGRPAAASPATGFAQVHARQQAALSDQAVGPLTENSDQAG